MTTNQSRRSLDFKSDDRSLWIRLHSSTLLNVGSSVKFKNQFLFENDIKPTMIMQVRFAWQNRLLNYLRKSHANRNHHQRQSMKLSIKWRELKNLHRSLWCLVLVRKNKILKPLLHIIEISTSLFLYQWWNSKFSLQQIKWNFKKYNFRLFVFLLPFTAVLFPTNRSSSFVCDAVYQL